MKKKIVFLFLGGILALLIIGFISISHESSCIRLDDSISCEVKFSDGSTRFFENNQFSTLDKGESVTASIPIPLNMGFEYPTLCFHIYNCTFELSHKGEVFFSSGQELQEKGVFIGNHYAKVVLPPETYGDEVTLVCVATENSASGQLTDVVVMESTSANKYPLLGKTIEFILLLAICMGAFIVLLYMILHGFKDRVNRLYIWTAFLTFIFPLYVLSSNGLLNVFLFGERICANAEYLAVFALPIPISLYFHDIVRGEKLRTVMRGMSLFYISYYILTTFLNYFSSIHYNVFLTPLHVFMIFGIIVYLTIPYIKVLGEDNLGGSSSLKIGTFALLFICLFDLVRFQLNQIMPILIYKNTLIPYGVLVMIGFMAKNAYHEYEQSLREIEKQSYLESLAYRDSLSGLMNRASCNKFVEDIKQNNIKDYSVLFIDLNGLKQVNDSLGHDEGDNMIRVFSSILERSFHGADILSRYGGDEFLIIYKKNISNRINIILKNFNKDIEYINSSGSYKFFVSAAIGYVFSTSDNPIDINEAIKTADENMYKNKRIVKLEKAMQ